MKQFGRLGIVAFILLAMVSTASAAEIKARGYWWIESVWANNWDFLGKGATTGEDKTFHIEQKMRTQFHFIASETLRGVLDTQIGTANWGSGLYAVGSGRTPGSATTTAPGSAAGGVGNIMLRQGYVEYMWPGTRVNFKVGFQTLTLPAAFGGGSAIFDDQAAAAVVSAPITDNVKLLAGYTRLLDSNYAQANTPSTSTAGTGSSTSTDAVFLAVPVDYSGVNITPFAMYAYGGKDTVAQNSGASSLAGFAGPNSSNAQGLRGYWGGIATTVTALENFKFMGDFNYGSVTYNNVPGSSSGGRKGFLFDIAADYTGLKMMTPELFFTYSSGENGNSSRGNTSERMPVVALPQNWAIGSFFFGERLELGGFIPTGGYTRATLGYWAGGLSLKDITFIDKLSHTFNLLYAKGTNDKDYIRESGGSVRNANYGGFLTEKDSLWEVDFNSRYKIYDELTAYLYLGYVNAHFDKEVWGTSSLLNAADLRQYGSKDAYKVGLGLNYFF